MNAATKHHPTAPPHAKAPASKAERRRGMHAGRKRHGAGTASTPHLAGIGAAQRPAKESTTRRRAIGRTSRRLAGAAAAIALAASSFAAVPTALATTGTTEVQLVASDEQLSVTVPSDLPVGVKGDGTFVFPGLTIQNNSVFDVHVASIKATAAEGFSIVDKDTLDAATGGNALWMTLAPTGATEIDLGSAIDTPAITPSGEWTIKRASSGAAGTLAIDGAGAINELSGIATDEQKALDVTFTIAPGA